MFKYVQQCIVLFMPKCQYLTVIFYLLQFKNPYIVSYVYMFISL